MNRHVLRAWRPGASLYYAVSTYDTSTTSPSSMSSDRGVAFIGMGSPSNLSTSRRLRWATSSCPSGHVLTKSMAFARAVGSGGGCGRCVVFSLCPLAAFVQVSQRSQPIRATTAYLLKRLVRLQLDLLRVPIAEPNLRRRENRVSSAFLFPAHSVGEWSSGRLRLGGCVRAPGW